MQTVKMINFILMCLFFACYMYQFLYIPVSWLPRKRRAREAPLHRFAVLIAACNEETVIGNLLDSIKAQSYPERFLEVFVVADNCRDKTAETARAHGAEVYERHNASLRGKGYACSTSSCAKWSAMRTTSLTATSSSTPTTCSSAISSPA